MNNFFYERATSKQLWKLNDLAATRCQLVTQIVAGGGESHLGSMKATINIPMPLTKEQVSTFIQQEMKTITLLQEMKDLLETD